MAPAGYEFWVGGRGYSSVQGSGGEVRARKEDHREAGWRERPGAGGLLSADPQPGALSEQAGRSFSLLHQRWPVPSRSKELGHLWDTQNLQTLPSRSSLPR